MIELVSREDFEVQRQWSEYEGLRASINLGLSECLAAKESLEIIQNKAGALEVGAIHGLPGTDKSNRHVLRFIYSKLYTKVGFVARVQMAIAKYTGEETITCKRTFISPLGCAGSTPATTYPFDLLYETLCGFKAHETELRPSGGLGDILEAEVKLVNELFPWVSAVGTKEGVILIPSVNYSSEDADIPLFEVMEKPPKIHFTFVESMTRFLLP